ncbi:MAG: T9SS C-terminal target domain-containing protein [Bacteroidetes bacterium]|nr:MAG: T9SS C-terminal target domain-containing protein [Bacteroidota bacterium]
MENKNNGGYLNIFHRLRLLPGMVFTLLFLTSVHGQDTLHVNSNVHILPGEVMEIPAGTVVWFHGYYHFNIEGSLIATGTDSAPILFTAADTTGLWDTHTNTGGWNGLRFSSSDKGTKEAPSLLQNCIFEFSKASKGDFQHGGAISVYGERDILIEDCMFYHNYAYRMGGAVYLNRNNAHIHNSRFAYNTAQNMESEVWAYGGGIATYESRVVISWSEFEFNSATGMGGALNFEKSHPTVYNTVISNNYAPLGGGVGVVRTLSANLFSNNLIIDNTALFFGGGMAFVDGSVIVANTNILNNTSAYGGGLYFNEISSPVFYNSIIRGNKMNMEVPNQVWIFDGVSGPEFYHCNIEGGFEDFYGSGGDDFQGVYLDNIDEDPMFENPESMNFSLAAGSPCIDAGLHDSEQVGIYHYDLAGNDRFSGIRVDIGAFEFQDPFTYYSLVIVAEGQGETHPPAGEHFYKENELVTLSASAHENWMFEHWITPLGSQEEEEIQIEMQSDYSVTAVFLPLTHIPEASGGSFSVYPNPFTNRLVLHSPLFSSGEELVVRVVNLSGETLLHHSVTNQRHGFTLPLDLSHLTSGMYLVVVEGFSETYTYKIVKE